MVRKKKEDIFISYMAKDEVSLATPLINKLEKSGLNISSLNLTTILKQKSSSDSFCIVNDMISNSKFGISIISKDYIKERWGLRIVAALFAKETDTKKTFIPIWHNISYDEIRSSLPLIADRFAIYSSDGLEEVINRVLAAISDGDHFLKNGHSIQIKNTEADLFLSFAEEDRIMVADKIAAALEDIDLKIWYSGDGLRNKVSDLFLYCNQGISKSKFGVVVISKDYIKKKWPLAEMNALISLETVDQRKVIPIWHNYSKEEADSLFPMLKDRLFLSTLENPEIIAGKIWQIIRGNDDQQSSFNSNTE